MARIAKNHAVKLALTLPRISSMVLPPDPEIREGSDRRKFDWGNTFAMDFFQEEFGGARSAIALPDVPPSSMGRQDETGDP